MTTNPMGFSNNSLKAARTTAGTLAKFCLLKRSSGIITPECVLKGQRDGTLKICVCGGWASWLLIALLK